MTLNPDPGLPDSFVSVAMEPLFNFYLGSDSIYSLPKPLPLGSVNPRLEPELLFLIWTAAHKHHLQELS